MTRDVYLCEKCMSPAAEEFQSTPQSDSQKGDYIITLRACRTCGYVEVVGVTIKGGDATV